MDSIDKVLDNANKRLKKAITSSDLEGGTFSGNKLALKQDLSAGIINLALRQTPFRDRVRREQGNGDAKQFNKKTALFKNNADRNPRNAIYGDGGLPKEVTPQYDNVLNAYVPVGEQGGVTGFAQAKARSLTDLVQQDIENTTRVVVQDEEWLNFWSRDDVANDSGLFGFQGLDQMIATNVIDANGASISKSLLDRAAEKIAVQGGMGVLTHIFTSIRVGIDLDNIYSDKTRVIVNQGEQTNLQLGESVRYVQTVAGRAEIVSDFFLNPSNSYVQPDGSSSFPDGSATSTVFLLAMPFIYMADLERLMLEKLGKTADSIDYFVKEYTTLVLEAEPWCAKIINVADSLTDASPEL